MKPRLYTLPHQIADATGLLFFAVCLFPIIFFAADWLRYGA